MANYKLQVQDDDLHPENWRDVTNGDGMPMVFAKESDARQKLMELFPVLVKMEQFQADRKRTRVVVINPYQDIDEAKDD